MVNPPAPPAPPPAVPCRPAGRERIELAWSQPPRFAPEAWDGLFAATAETASAAALAPRRHGIAVLLAWASAEGWIAETDLAAALDDPSPNGALHRLLARGLDALCAWLWTEATRVLPAGLSPPDNHAWLTFNLDDAITLSHSGAGRPDEDPASDPDPVLRLDLASPWDYAFDLNALPLPLARAVYDLFRQLADRLHVGILPPEVREGYGLTSELSDTQARLETAGAAHDPARTLAWLRETGEDAFWGITDVAEAADLLVRLEQATAPNPPWMTPPGAGEDGDASGASNDKKRARIGSATGFQVWLDGALGWLWTGRREQPALYRHPWGRVLRRAILALRRWSRRYPVPGAVEADAESSLVAGWDEDGEVPLEYGCGIGCGLPGEREALDGLRQQMMEAGELPCLRLRLRRDGLPALRRRLAGLAVAQGVLLLAEQVANRSARAAGYG